MLGALILSLSCALPFQAYASDLTEEQALDLLVNKIRSSRLYESRIKLECIGFKTEKQTLTVIDFKVYENHRGAGCEGDKNTAPTLDRFRVIKKTKEIKWHQISRDQFVAFDRALKKT